MWWMSSQISASFYFIPPVLHVLCRKMSWMTSLLNWARCRVSRWGVMMSSTPTEGPHHIIIVMSHCTVWILSLKVVAKKRRDRGLPRAFEIFTDSKTYVLKAQDEKHAEEWLQCINVAVAQARERENREATTYLWQPWRCTKHTIFVGWSSNRQTQKACDAEHTDFS